MQTLPEGSIAPSFTLLNQDGHTVSLNQYKNKQNVLIYFYPKAMTPGCTTQAKELSKIKDYLISKNTIILGISPDNTQRLKKFEIRDDLTIQLLGDEDHSVANNYGVWGQKKFMGKTYNGIHRISFFIDMNGNIEKVFKNFKAKNHHEVVLEYINRP